MVDSKDTINYTRTCMENSHRASKRANDAPESCVGAGKTGECTNAEDEQQRTGGRDSSEESLASLCCEVIESSLYRENNASGGGLRWVAPIPAAPSTTIRALPSEAGTLSTTDIPISLDDVIDLAKEMKDRISDIYTLSNNCRRGGGLVGSLWQYDRGGTPSPSPRMASQPQHIDVHQFLGSGSFGSVHAASVNGISRAVKSIRAKTAELEKLVLEAEIGYHMMQPNIVRTFSYQIYDDASCNVLAAGNSCMQVARNDLSLLESDEYVSVRIVQELCDIGPLTKYIREDESIKAASPALPTKECCVLIALDVVSALIYLKHQGIIHGDLSGNNVLLTSDTTSPLGLRAKVCDFGRSRLARVKMMTNSLGTVSYMPPEMVLSGELNSNTDMYSLGILMIEMLTKKLVWVRQQPVQILFAMSSGRRVEVPLQGIPSDMRDFLVSCLRDDPDERPTPEMAFDILKTMIPPGLVQAHLGKECDLVIPCN